MNEQLESNVKSYCRQYPAVFNKASGAMLMDEEGREYIDFFSGAGALNYGHNNSLLKKSLVQYIMDDGITHGLDFSTTAKNAFIGALSDTILKPRGMDYKIQFTGPTGTNAVEAALKIARNATGRQNVIAFSRGFHGVSMGSLAATANAHYREASGYPLSGVSFMPYDGYLGEQINTIDYLEKVLADKSSGIDYPAAMLVETIQAEGGVNVASFEWLRSLAVLCKKHEILLIIDDIQVGCGRTGSFFSFENADISPDIIVMSKSLSGFGLPLSMVLMKPELDQWKPGQHNGTFRGNNLAFITAKATLEEYWQDTNFTKSVIQKGQLVSNALNRIATEYPERHISVRGRGMIQGLDLSDGELSRGVVAKAFEKGLIIENCGANGSVLKCLPSLTISRSLLEQGLQILKSSVAEVMPNSL